MRPARLVERACRGRRRRAHGSSGARHDPRGVGTRTTRATTAASNTIPTPRIGRLRAATDSRPATASTPSATIVGRRDREEVPVVVDERMTDVRGGGGDERDRGCALGASEPAKRADAHGCAAAGSARRRARTRPRLRRRAAEAGRCAAGATFRAFGRKRFRAISNVPAPAPSGACCANTSHASSHQHRRVADVERAEPARVVDDLGAVTAR